MELGGGVGVWLVLQPKTDGMDRTLRISMAILGGREGGRAYKLFEACLFSQVSCNFEPHLRGNVYVQYTT